MNPSPFALPLTLIVLSVSSLIASGQVPVPGVPPRRASAEPPAQVRQEPATLSTNFRITFSGKSGEKSIGELSCLTCSKAISLSGPLDSSDTPTTFNVRGTLEEKDGVVLFSYSLNYRCAVTTAVHQPQPGQPQQPGGYRSVQYLDHSTEGTLKMKPGQSYDLLRAGGNTYSIIVAPQIEKSPTK